MVSLTDSGLVRLSHPVNGTKTQIQLEKQRQLTLMSSVMLPKLAKLFVVSKEGFLYQVGFINPSRFLQKQNNETAALSFNVKII